MQKTDSHPADPTDTPVPGTGNHRLFSSKPDKSGYQNPLEWVWSLLDDGEAIGRQ